jgi:hypothetical protein
MNGYTKMHRLDIEARADMIETVAGMEGDGWRVKRELLYAMGDADYDDADSLRWLACVIERRLIELGEGS